MKDIVSNYVLSTLFVYSFCSELKRNAPVVASDEESAERVLPYEPEPFLEKYGFPNFGDIPVLNGKVIKGKRVTIKEHPYIASIRRNVVHYLTGTILTRNLILTVAHPLIDVPIYELGVVVGENYSDRGSTINTVVLVIIHEDFDPFNLQSDIAILRLFENIVFKFSIKNIDLVPSGIDLNGATAFVTGWARCDAMGVDLCLPRSSIYSRDETFDSMLRTVSFRIISPNYYCEGYARNELQINLKTMRCIGPAREGNPVCPCLAVPGAPLVVNATLAGLSSWGFGCGYEFDLPLIYTDITASREWILTNIAIQHDIKERNLALLYQATKAYFVLKWINETRLTQPTFVPKSDAYMEPLDIDKKLIAIPGTVYDIRDYVKDGAYHDFKMQLYEEIRTGIIRMEKYKLTQNLMVLPKRPFLGKEVLNENN